MKHLMTGTLLVLIGLIGIGTAEVNGTDPSPSSTISVIPTSDTGPTATKGSLGIGTTEVNGSDPSPSSTISVIPTSGSDAGPTVTKENAEASTAKKGMTSSQKEDSTSPSNNGHTYETSPAIGGTTTETPGSEGQGYTATSVAKETSAATSVVKDTTTAVVKDTTTAVTGCYKYTRTCSNTTHCAPHSINDTVPCNFKSKVCLISETKEGNRTTLTADCVEASCIDDHLNSVASGSLNKKCCSSTRCNTESFLHAGSPPVRGLIPLMLVTLGVRGMFV